MTKTREELAELQREADRRVAARLRRGLVVGVLGALVALVSLALAAWAYGPGAAVIGLLGAGGLVAALVGLDEVSSVSRSGRW